MFAEHEVSKNVFGVGYAKHQLPLLHIQNAAPQFSRQFFITLDENSRASDVNMCRAENRSGRFDYLDNTVIRTLRVNRTYADHVGTERLLAAGTTRTGLEILQPVRPAFASICLFVNASSNPDGPFDHAKSALESHRDNSRNTDARLIFASKSIAAQVHLVLGVVYLSNKIIVERLVETVAFRRREILKCGSWFEASIYAGSKCR